MATIQRDQAIAWYFQFREIERSLHLVLNPALAWRDFQEYFTEPRIDALHALQDLLKTEVRNESSISVQCMEPHEPGLVRILILTLVGRWQRSLTLTNSQCAYFHRALAAFFEVLGQSTKPDSDRLIELRQMFFRCGYIIEARGRGWRELCATNFEWFGRLTLPPATAKGKALPEVA
jgi:hypothetical protein